MEHQTPSGFPGNFRKRKVLGTLWFPSGLPETLGKAKLAVGVEATRSVQLAAERRLRRRRPQLGRALRSDSERVGGGVVFFLSF